MAAIKNLKCAHALVTLLFLNSCIHYTVKVNVLPEEEVEVFIGGIPKGKTDENGELEFNHRDTPSFKSPVIYFKKDSFEGWFQWNFKNRFWLNNVSSIKIDTTEAKKKSLYKINITFLLDSSYLNNTAHSFPGKKYRFKKPYFPKPPNPPHYRILTGCLLVIYGMIGNISAAKLISGVREWEKDPDPPFLSGWGYAFDLLWARLLQGSGTISLGVGIPLLINSRIKIQNYREWERYEKANQPTM